MVELGELLVEVVPWAAWAFFMKNGTDATTAAVRVARAKTGPLPMAVNFCRGSSRHPSDRCPRVAAVSVDRWVIASDRSWHRR